MHSHFSRLFVVQVYELNFCLQLLLCHHVKLLHFKIKLLSKTPCTKLQLYLDCTIKMLVNRSERDLTKTRLSEHIGNWTPMKLLVTFTVLSFPDHQIQIVHVHIWNPKIISLPFLASYLEFQSMTWLTQHCVRGLYTATHNNPVSTQE